VDDISDLSGGMVVVREGSSAESFMKNNHPDIGLAFSDPFTADVMLRNGDVDGRVTGDHDTDEFTKTVIGRHPTAFPADPAQQGVVDEVNSALAAMIADGSYAEIYERWFDTNDLRVDS
jgi:ABC-type amino acid transport substrate-binding protein